MREREPIVESYPPVKLDERMFDALAEVAGHVEDEEDRTLLEGSIARCKRGSFEYAEEALNRMLGKEAPKEEKSGEEMTEEEKRWVILGGKEKKASHEIVSRMSGLALVMDKLEIPKEGWPVYGQENPKRQEPLKTAALRYAFSKALEYEKLTRDGQVSKEEVLERLGLAGAVGADFLEKHVVQKIEELPLYLKEHLFQ